MGKHSQPENTENTENMNTVPDENNVNKHENTTDNDNNVHDDSMSTVVDSGSDDGEGGKTLSKAPGSDVRVTNGSSADNSLEGALRASNEDRDEGLEESDDNNEYNVNKRANILVIIIGVLSVLLIGVTGAFLVYMSNDSDALVKPNPEDVMIDKIEKVVPIPVNTEIVDMENGEEGLETVETIDSDTRGAFVFAGDEEITPDTKIVDMYVTFSGQKSVDMLLSNFNALEAAVADNQFVLVIHPVATTNSISITVPEALAQAFSSNNKDKSWEFLANLLASSRLHYASGYDEEDVEKSILLGAKDLGFSDITQETLNDEPFLSWVFAKEEVIPQKIADYVPAIYVNGEKLDHKEIVFNDNSELMKALLKDDE